MKKTKFSLQPPISPEQHLIGLNPSFEIIRNIDTTNKTMRPEKSLAVFNNLRNISKEHLETLTLSEMLNKSSSSYDR